MENQKCCQCNNHQHQNVPKAIVLSLALPIPSKPEKSYAEIAKTNARLAKTIDSCLNHFAKEMHKKINSAETQKILKDDRTFLKRMRVDEFKPTLRQVKQQLIKEYDLGLFRLTKSTDGKGVKLVRWNGLFYQEA
ncbi:MAG: hypothetical protein A2Y12_01220 [Planctomycetes bacterium GWF2_42_9]|nr:MAG: hypothetical protein A2Y12_01220 [Planctomycetes bacterium GWF2_42_9]